MDLGLDGRAYVVTGGTRGLGLASAQALVAEGARVLVSSRSAEAVTAAVLALGPLARGLVADNTEASTAERLVNECIAEHGRVDGALISVGGPPATSALDASDEQWRAAFESVFLGAVRTCRSVAARLTDGGSIGLVLSSSVKAPVGGIAISNGLRPGLAMWAKQLADELGPRGIRVVSLLPGFVATDRITELFGGAPGTESVAANIPLRRLGDPAEFGRIAAFVLSPAASYLTGCVIPVDGGSIRAL
ncbi:MAG: 3-oxoacyl-[acyl-carrier protein] reductase [Frankiaceae bacterium]|jgi:3-oxoacyl-[acyl-carrier protein] reductase|nr:3-oxoacyl-[acyl-carrier protein] reductase [Frankiaceae bacterium]